MKKHTLAVPSAVALIATIIALNALGAAALPVSGQGEGTRVTAEGNAANPTSTPVPGATDGDRLLQRLSPASPAIDEAGSLLSGSTIRELAAQTDVRTTETLRRAPFPFRPLIGTKSEQAVTPRFPSAAQTCVDVLLNPQLNVVEFGDGTGSIDYWSILFSQVCYETEGAYVWSPSHSLTMSDGNCAASPDEDLVDDWDYDAFGQGFWAPAGLTYLSASYQRLYGDVDDYDSAVSSLWTLDSEGYLLEEIAAYTIGQTPDGWSPRQWALDSSGLEQASGQPLALVFYFWGDLLPPYEWIWLDDVQVTLCYDVGQYAVYLPLLAKQPPPPSQPTCSPREPDSLAQPGSTARDATCGGSFSPLDEKDYYLLDLRGHPRIRLRLFNLPPGTNWDALVYENTGGYPLACQIGTPGSGDKSADCNLDLGKDYFVLVSRGPNRTGGSYSMQAKTR